MICFLSEIKPHGCAILQLCNRVVEGCCAVALLRWQKVRFEKKSREKFGKRKMFDVYLHRVCRSVRQSGRTD